jgi:hypothetical protein
MRVVPARFGSWFALLALTIQIVVSLGHLNAHEARSICASPSGQQDFCKRSVAKWSVDGRKGFTTPHGTLADVLDHCAICSLTGPIDPLTAPPTLLMREIAGLAHFQPPQERPLAAWPHRLAQARAPPAA